MSMDIDDHEEDLISWLHYNQLQDQLSESTMKLLEFVEESLMRQSRTQISRGGRFWEEDLCHCSDAYFKAKMRIGRHAFEQVLLAIKPLLDLDPKGDNLLLVNMNSKKTL